MQDANAPILVITRRECRALDWLNPAASRSGVGTCLPLDPELVRAGHHDLPCACSEDVDSLNCEARGGALDGRTLARRSRLRSRV